MQRLVDKVSAVFVPVVLVLALITLLGWLWARRGHGSGADPRRGSAGDCPPLRAGAGHNWRPSWRASEVAAGHPDQTQAGGGA